MLPWDQFVATVNPCKNDDWKIISLRYREEVILMQFTGLKDNNGKEIYEGDICRFGSGMVAPIIWKDGGLGYESYPGSDYVDFHGFSGHQWLKEILSTLEIIGNIYENPDLLTPPKQ